MVRTSELVEGFPTCVPEIFDEALRRFEISLSEQHSDDGSCPNPGDCRTAELVNWLASVDHHELVGLALDLLGYSAWVQGE